MTFAIIIRKITDFFETEEEVVKKNKTKTKEVKKSNEDLLSKTNNLHEQEHTNKTINSFNNTSDSSKKINFGRFSEWPWYLKFLLSVITIFGTYNTFSTYHIFHYIIIMDYTNLFNYAFILSFIGFWLVMITGIKKNMGYKGIFGLTLIFGLLFGGIFQTGLINISYNSLMIGFELITSLIVFLGLIWPEIRKKLFGVIVVDEEDTDGSE